MKGKKEFFKYEYPSSHWSIDFTKAGTSIALITFRDKYHYSVILNPTDCRGYRTIIRYLNEGDSKVSSAFNRPYTLAEQRGLTEVTALMTQIYEKLGLIVQFSQLGNNSQSLNKKSGVILLGNKDEPSLLHVHMWGRGDPEVEYIPGVRLRGPEPGLMFDLIAKNKTHPVNQYALKWDEKELKTSRTMFQHTLISYTKSPEFIEEFGRTLKVTVIDEKIFKESVTINFDFFSRLTEDKTSSHSTESKLLSK